MKNFKILIVLSLTALVFACSPENEAVPTPSESQDLVLNQSTTKSSSNLFEDENALAWAAFITGKILFNTQNASERSYFNTNYGNGGYVDFEDLLGSSPDSPGFKAKFIDFVEYYIENGDSNNGCPDGEEQDPEPPLGDNDNKLSVIEQVQLYLDFLITDNCAELYFPDGLSLSGIVKVTTAAHPFNTDLENNGIRRFFQLNCDNAGNTEAVTVKHDYIAVDGNENVIIGRFRKDTQVLNCTYTEYSAFDFETFLQGPF